MQTGTVLPAHALKALGSALRGALITPGTSSYDVARAVHNGGIDRYPGAIAKCVDIADVVTCVRVAHEHDVRTAIRCGGHSGAGLGTCDGGLVIDLSLMRGVRVDPSAGTAQVEGGCTWGAVDHATHEFGLAVPSGIVSTTGVGGLALGGGSGHLSRAYGLTIDNLEAADVVLADGTFVTADAETHPDLFWALRGGCGNFGVVTSFRFRCHPVRNVIAGPVFYDVSRTGEVLRWYREFLPYAPRELNGFFLVGAVPPAEQFPAQLHGHRVCGALWIYTGETSRAEDILAPVRQLGAPLLDGIGELPFPALQSAFDGLYPPGLQWYWRGDFFTQITDDAIAAHEQYAEVPTLHSTMHLYPVDGAVHDVAADDTAFAYRHANWNGVIAGVDPAPANADLIREWAIRYWEALHPTSAGGAYVNFMMDEGHDRVRATYGAHFARLADVKAMYDPDNFFHINPNIPPAR
ncbi:FAD-binding oxidoreductase [Hoyosella sp. YIM 151337]|uniref:FAD-binding oxidoreductase n=1 Tax=Hoyosella sp. YIM 151337 TaxID=2992742 RepID=UPI002235796C|nr:FAD-binding oxidoreductase [Hoyosella sp. YIM 151337]MCW4355040.1 FAD-binding oxidoreductase [Hoyosella sp. YIM 151337]